MEKWSAFRGRISEGAQPLKWRKGVGGRGIQGAVDGDYLEDDG